MIDERSIPTIVPEPAPAKAELVEAVVEQVVRLRPRQADGTFFCHTCDVALFPEEYASGFCRPHQASRILNSCTVDDFERQEEDEVREAQVLMGLAPGGQPR